ncbi:hypothetical protein D3C80_2221300 [compost metagenome]
MRKKSGVPQQGIIDQVLIGFRQIGIGRIMLDAYGFKLPVLARIFGIELERDPFAWADFDY